MKEYIIGLIVIGIILLAVMGAFIFSDKFRKDVIASEGEASVFGLLNVKGVIIVLLTAVFCGAFIYIISLTKTPELPEIKVPKLNITEEGAKKIVVPDSVGVDKYVFRPDITTHMKVSTVGNISEHMKDREYSIGRLHYIIKDIDRHISGSKTLYFYTVLFGEADKNNNKKVIWNESPDDIEKTENGRIDPHCYLTLKNDKWENSYSVVMAFGQPDESLSMVDLCTIIVNSSSVERDD